MLAISISKAAGFITYRDFNTDEARKWFPISLLLIGMIYTSAKALQFLSVPVYTIFKNLTIILIAYGEVLWFGGSVTGTALFQLWVDGFELRCRGVGGHTKRVAIIRRRHNER